MKPVSPHRASASAVQRAADVTPWFSMHHFAPVLIGWYECRWADLQPAETEMQFWTGASFQYVEARTDSDGGGVFISFTKTAMGEMPGDAWRGLCQPATAPPMSKRSVK